MFRTTILAAVALTIFTLAQPVAAKRIAIINLTTTQKAIQADAVITGKVAEIEKEEVEVLPFTGATDKVKMRVAIVKISDSFLGVKNITQVKVLLPSAATEQPAEPQPGGPAVRPQPGRGGYGPITLKVGDEGLYFLAKHPTDATFHVINAGNNPVEAKADTYKAELAKVKAVVATLSEPMTALKAEKAEDRLRAAATLIQKYRRGMSVPIKEEAIPTEETKAILKILADADWTAAEKPQAPGTVIDYQAQPQNLVGQLGLYPGGNGIAQIQVKPGESYAAKYHEAFKAWLAKDGDKFQIKKFVPKD